MSGRPDHIRQEARGTVSEADVTYFPPAYLERADQIFLRPGRRYSWEQIVAGAPVRSTTFRSTLGISRASPLMNWVIVMPRADT